MMVDQYDADKVTPLRRRVPPEAATSSRALAAQRRRFGAAAVGRFELAPDLRPKRRL